jgi:transposase
MSATHELDRSTAAQPTLYLAFELGWTDWGLAFSTNAAQRPRRVTIKARSLDALEREILRAKRRFRLPDDAPVISCFEAGRDGFWLHRFLAARGVTNLVVDASSIEVNRRFRRAKSDGIDVLKLLSMLIQYCHGERNRWSVVNVPTPGDEDRRQPQRERARLVSERTGHINRIKGLMATLGLDVIVDGDLMKRVDELRQWDGSPVPIEMRARIERELERWRLVDTQIDHLESQQRARVRKGEVAHIDTVRSLLDLKGVGFVTAWMLATEVFAWRKIRNRRQLAGLVGLDPTPYQSGDLRREQGISKAGNRRIRWGLVELAWMWLRYQPDSELSKWYERRFGNGNTRARKVGIVALARKLLIALWKYLEQGEIPQGAVLLTWQQKVGRREPVRARTA